LVPDVEELLADDPLLQPRPDAAAEAAAEAALLAPVKTWIKWLLPLPLS